MVGYFYSYMPMCQDSNVFIFPEELRICHFLGAFAKLRIATIRFFTSVLPSACSNSAPTGWIFMKSDLRIFRKSIEKSQVLLQEYLVSGTGNEAPRYVVFSSPPPYLVPLKSDYLSQHYILEKP